MAHMHRLSIFWCRPDCRVSPTVGRSMVEAAAHSTPLQHHLGRFWGIFTQPEGGGYEPKPSAPITAFDWMNTAAPSLAAGMGAPHWQWISQPSASCNVVRKSTTRDGGCNRGLPAAAGTDHRPGHTTWPSAARLGGLDPPRRWVNPLAWWPGGGGAARASGEAQARILEWPPQASPARWPALQVASRAAAGRRRPWLKGGRQALPGFEERPAGRPRAIEGFSAVSSGSVLPVPGCSSSNGADPIEQAAEAISLRAETGPDR